MRFLAPLALIAFCVLPCRAEEPAAYVANFGRLGDIAPRAAELTIEAAPAPPVSVNFYRLLNVAETPQQPDLVELPAVLALSEKVREQAGELRDLRAKLAALKDPATNRPPAPPILPSDALRGTAGTLPGLPGWTYQWTDGTWRTNPEPGRRYPPQSLPIAANGSQCRLTPNGWKCE